MIKTRQLEAGFDEEACSVDAPPGVLAVARTLVAEEGALVLFSGALERVLRSAPQFGVTLALYDVLTSACAEHGLLPGVG